MPQPVQLPDGLTVMARLPINAPASEKIALADVIALDTMADHFRIFDRTRRRL